MSTPVDLRAFQNSFPPIAALSLSGAANATFPYLPPDREIQQDHAYDHQNREDGESDAEGFAGLFME
jgi:hypothetical protein